MMWNNKFTLSYVLIWCWTTSTPNMGSESCQQFQAIRITRCGIKSWKKQDSNFLPLCLQLLWASLPIQQDLAIHWWHLHGHSMVQTHEIMKSHPAWIRCGMISGTYYKVWNLVEESNSRKLHLPLKTIHQMFTFQFVYRSVSQSWQCHRPSFSSTDSPRYLDIQGWWDDP